MDIIERLDDLIKQATTERSHYYTADTAKLARAEIERLRAILITISAVLENGREDKQNDKHPKGSKQVGHD
jgi:voltage-gated potassium channel Kch